MAKLKPIKFKDSDSYIKSSDRDAAEKYNKGIKQFRFTPGLNYQGLKGKEKEVYEGLSFITHMQQYWRDNYGPRGGKAYSGAWIIDAILQNRPITKKNGNTPSPYPAIAKLEKKGYDSFISRFARLVGGPNVQPKDDYKFIVEIAGIPAIAWFEDNTKFNKKYGNINIADKFVMPEFKFGQYKKSSKLSDPVDVDVYNLSQELRAWYTHEEEHGAGGYLGRGGYGHWTKSYIDNWHRTWEKKYKNLHRSDKDAIENIVSAYGSLEGDGDNYWIDQLMNNEPYGDALQLAAKDFWDYNGPYN